GVYESDGTTPVTTPFALSIGETKDIVVRVLVEEIGQVETTVVWATPSLDPVGRDNVTLTTASYSDLILLPASIVVYSTEMRVNIGTEEAAGVPASINVTVENIGYSDASDVLVRIWDTDGQGDDVFFGQGTIASIPTGGQASINITGRPYKWGLNIFEIYIDPDETIPETNEDNNMASHDKTYDFFSLSSDPYNVNVTMNREMQYTSQHYSSGALLLSPWITSHSSMIFNISGNEYITSEQDLSQYITKELHLTSNTSAEMTYIFSEGVEANIRMALANEEMSRASVLFTNLNATDSHTAGLRQYISLYNDVQEDWIIYGEDFENWESSPQLPGWENTSNPIKGWEHWGENDAWAFGYPNGDLLDTNNDTLGPLGGYQAGDQYCWGTNSDILHPIEFRGGYGDSTSSSAILTSQLNSSFYDLSGATTITISMWEWVDLEDVDTREVLLKDANSHETLYTVITKASTDRNWTQITSPLIEGTAGRTVYLQFNLYSDNANVQAGWFIDNITITGKAEEGIAWTSTSSDPNTLIENETTHYSTYAFDNILYHTFYDPENPNHFEQSQMNSTLYVGMEGGNTPPDQVQLINGSHFDAPRTWDYGTTSTDGLYTNGQSSQLGTAMRWDPVTLESHYLNPTQSQTEIVAHFGTAQVNPLPADLTVVDSMIKLSPAGPVDEEQIVYINASVYNIGGTASTSFKVEIWDGIPGSGVLVHEEIMASLGPYGVEAAEISTTWAAIGDGLHNIYVVVDPLDQIVEVREDNNQGMNAIEVIGTAVMPELISGEVNGGVGASGTPGDNFQFNVTYRHDLGLAPMLIQIEVNGSWHDMAWLSGANSTGATYTWTWDSTGAPDGGYDYRFRARDTDSIWATNQNGTILGTVTLASGVLEPPTDVDITMSTDGTTVTVTWTDSITVGVVGYIFMRDTDPAFPAPTILCDVTPIGPGVQTYDDTGVDDNVEYYYKVGVRKAVDVYNDTVLAKSVLVLGAGMNLFGMDLPIDLIRPDGGFGPEGCKN
ncbi:MAG: hypothetical protein KAT70_02320, partial [Thermoplasmata archaeon]|nr:hypothetical protein [Thermoplasmata archaeon]